MARTTSTAVSAIIEVQVGDDLTPFIEFANTIVTDNCTSSGYSDGKLEIIERWLSAWAYRALRPRTTFESVGKVQESTESKVGLGFDSNNYGQNAMLMDTAGNLAILNALMKKGITGRMTATWLGTECLS